MSEPRTPTGWLLLARGVQMYTEASDGSAHRLVAGIIVSPAELLEVELEAAALAGPGADRLREALSFAASVIKSGEPWTETCERVIGGALHRREES